MMMMMMMMLIRADKKIGLRAMTKGAFGLWNERKILRDRWLAEHERMWRQEQSALTKGPPMALLKTMIDRWMDAETGGIHFRDDER